MSLPKTIQNGFHDYIQAKPQFGGDVLMINIWFIILILSSSFNDNILLFELLMVRLVPSITRWCLDPLVAWPAPLTPGLDPPLEEEGGNNDSEFKEISNPNSDWSERPLSPLGGGGKEWWKLFHQNSGRSNSHLRILRATIKFFLAASSYPWAGPTFLW